jgi:IS30 family transposase
VSFVERAEMALLKTPGLGVRDIARRLRRDPSTISREPRRNAATRRGKSALPRVGGSVDGCPNSYGCR